MTPLDIAVVVGWLGLSSLMGLWFTRRASASIEGFFVGDRSLPWWAIGTSMVATTFAADTPLAVSGYVAAQGIAANWRWWFSGVGAVATVFLFARLWRRSQVITEAELVELRYGGSAAGWLRGVKAVWFGVFMNVLVIAWVMRAMRKVVEVVLDLDAGARFLGVPSDVAIVLALFALAVGYTVASGMFGVVATDVVQFPLAMAGSVLLAVLSWRHVGGLAGLRAGFTRHGFDWEATTSLLPLNDPSPDGSTAQLAVLLGVIWWASRNADGGSYLAQRLLSARDENHALWGYLWFAVANVCVRPWPWIVVGLCGMASLGPLDDPETYYPRMMTSVVPPGLFGMMLAAFLAAFMSTVDTQLHWGASLLVNDLFGRFVAPGASSRQLLLASRLSVVALGVAGAAASFALEDIRWAWELAISVTAGIGAVHVARWYWWRTNAHAEFAALAIAAVGTALFGWLRAHHPSGASGDSEVWPWLAQLPRGWLAFPFDAAAIVSLSVPLWVLVAFVTPAGERAHLRAFYARVRPGGPGWRAVAGDMPGFAQDGPSWGTLVGILAGCAALFGCLLGVGEAIVGRFDAAATWASLALLGTLLCARQVRRETAVG